eukprot:Seg1747.6 transcript_id=Seg1747.6/GoldUCD/mRNA.D3Y31 product="hypothetical protein" protein_id=Seg1747.6/GoldUCD/D3Y31
MSSSHRLVVLEMLKSIFVVLMLISTIVSKASGRPKQHEEDVDQYRRDLIHKFSLKDAVKYAHRALASERRKQKREELGYVDDNDYDEDDENLREDACDDEEEEDYQFDDLTDHENSSSSDLSKDQIWPAYRPIVQRRQWVCTQARYIVAAVILRVHEKIKEKKEEWPEWTTSENG